MGPIAALLFLAVGATAITVLVKVIKRIIS